MIRLTSYRDWIEKATRFRYSLPVLAELRRDQGCKFITLVRRLDASDRAVRQALNHLTGLGWVERNPGYGHPSRPEYVLTQGAPDTLPIWNELRKWNQENVALERWPLPILFAIVDGKTRYSSLMQELGGITPRSLSMGLGSLLNAGLAIRDLKPGYPPTTEYRATPWGESMAKL